MTTSITKGAKTFTRSELELMLRTVKDAEAAAKRTEDAKIAQPIVTRLADTLGKSDKSDWHGAVERLRFTDADGADWAVKIVVTAMNAEARERCV